MFVRVKCVGLTSLLHSVRFGQMLRCAHKRIVNIMKVYIERNNIQVELIRFRKNIDFIHVYVCEARGLAIHGMFTAYSLPESDSSTPRYAHRQHSSPTVPSVLYKAAVSLCVCVCARVRVCACVRVCVCLSVCLSIGLPPFFPTRPSDSVPD